MGRTPDEGRCPPARQGTVPAVRVRLPRHGAARRNRLGQRDGATLRAIPTILRPYTGGEKNVTGDGADLRALIADLDSRYPGISERLVDEQGLRRFVNVYLNDEDVRFLGGLDTAVADGDSVTILPAVAGG